MTKKEISYTDLVKVTMDKARAEAKKLGKDFDNRAAFSAAAKRWGDVKKGIDSEFTKGESSPKTRKKGKKAKKAKKSRKVEVEEEEDVEDKPSEEPESGHKGAPSITRPGHKDFRTAKGFKYYHREGHLEDFNKEGVKGKPYSHRHKHPKSANDVLKMMDDCLEKDMTLQECRDRVAAAMNKTTKKGKKKGKKTRKRKNKKHKK